MKRKGWMWGLALAAALGLGGCARGIQPLPQRLDEAGVPHSIKRIEQFPQRDFLHHWVRTAYLRPDHMFTAVGPSQHNVVKLWGRPDWIRKPFRSTENERVQEWIYLDKLHIFQFVGPDIVYDGPLTDYEQVLLQKGYPDRAHGVRRTNGERDDLFVYNKVFTPWLEEFKFQNGRIIESQEGF